LTTPTFNRTELDSPITEFAISIGAYQKNEYVVSGTATFIAPHLAITAKHVIEHYWRVFKHSELKLPDSDFHQELKGNFNMIGVQFLNKGTTTPALWNVTKLFFSRITDIVFLVMSPFSTTAREYKWRYPTIDFNPPKINSTISCFGYKDTFAEAEHNDVKWKLDPTTSTGKVIEIHKTKRDNFSINFPCIHTNARFDPGMSGGPVFNDQGLLCGVISANLPPSEEGEEHASYAALIWPSMSTPINLKREGIKENEYYPIFDLFKNNFVKSNNIDKLSLKYLEDQKIYRLQFKD
jgi:V8-like Glu-specific endopeptidase